MQRFLAAVLFTFAPVVACADTARGLADFREGRFAEAIQQWRVSAAEGDGQAALYAGVMSDTGLGAQRDYATALNWYRRAAEVGNASGAFNAGVMFDAGLGTAPDPAEAASWYARAAGLGSGRGAYALALMTEAGTGVPRDPERAVALYRQAAALGVSAARAHLQQLGLAAPAPGKLAAARPRSDVPRSDVPRNDAPRGDASMDDFQQAQRALLGRGPANMARAAALFRRSAEDNNPLAEYDLAYCYEHGLGVPPSRTDAYEWYRRAASHAADADLKQVATAGMRSVESKLTEAELRQIALGQ